MGRCQELGMWGRDGGGRSHRFRLAENRMIENNIVVSWPLSILTFDMWHKD